MATLKLIEDEEKMKKILRFEVEEGGTFDCSLCPVSVRKYDRDRDEYKYTCNDRNPFCCTKYDLTTLKLIAEDV